MQNDHHLRVQVEAERSIPMKHMPLENEEMQMSVDIFGSTGASEALPLVIARPVLMLVEWYEMASSQHTRYCRYQRILQT